jgi:hypothetical protein
LVETCWGKEIEKIFKHSLDDGTFFKNKNSMLAKNEETIQKLTTLLS